MTNEPAKPRVLATDLDGTLIPLDDAPHNQSDLVALSQELTAVNATLVFSTGRHLASVMEAMRLHELPLPSWIICDVGTSIYQCAAATVDLAEEYQRTLARIVEDMPLIELQRRLDPFVQSGSLQLQESEKQGQFKLSYYARTSAAECARTVNEIRELLAEWGAPYSMIDSVDPFNGDGLIDLLPRNVSKAFALRWLAAHQQWPEQEVVFAGDSGNDLAALTAGFLAIVVGNAHREVAAAAESAHEAAGWSQRLYLAEQSATSGVLEGCRQFGLL